jgi:two-component system, sensor histidine kinase and response regulator
MLEQMEMLLRQVMADIDSLSTAAAESPVSAAVPLDPVSLQERLERLGHALEFDLGAAEPLLAEIRAGVNGTPMESNIATIAARVEVFDIDTALALLTELQDELKPATGGI